jgi:hypothetical protein
MFRGTPEHTGFSDAAYVVPTSDSLAAFFRDLIGDSVPSAVVFAMDILPTSVAPVLADTVLLSRYLEAGGKIVSFSAPLGSVVRDSTGKVLGDDPKRMEQLLGIPAAALDYDEDLAAPTPAGRNWGVNLPLRGDYPMSPEAVTHLLAANPNGRATAWVKEYWKGRPGSGYVQLWGFGASVERLPLIRAVTEYGLLRAVQ